jgi:prophage antirepressor-like protein
MNTELQTFQFQSHQLTVLTDEHGDPWFIAMEVAKILEYSDAHKMTLKLDEDEIQNRQISGSGFNNKGTIIINESGLWSSVLRSAKPEAKAVKKWLTAEVLPAIRKTGSYGAQPPHPLLPPITTPLTLTEFQNYRTTLQAGIEGLVDDILNATPLIISAADYMAMSKKAAALIKYADVSPAPLPSGRTHRAWTAEEDEVVGQMLAQEYTHARIGQQLGRTKQSIRCRAGVLAKRQGGAA